MADLSFYAPQARLVNADDATTIAATTTSDLVSVQVTQINNGPCTLNVVVNNQIEQLQGKSMPFFPPWKYNGLDLYRPGQRVLVDFRYGGTDSDWQTMIFARITRVTFSFPSSSGAQMTLEGEDMLSLLKNSDEKDKNYNGEIEDKIVEDIVKTRSQSGLGYDGDPPPNVTSGLKGKTHTKKTAYFDFIKGLADPLDYEVWIDDGSYDFDSPNDAPVSLVPSAPPALSSVTVKFKAARSLQLADTLTMVWGGGDQSTFVNITDFTAKLQVADQYASATASGAKPDNSGKATGLADSSEIDKDLHAGTNKAGDTLPVINAPDVRAQYFLASPGEKAIPLSVDTSNLDDARAKLKAAAELRKKARELLTVTGTAVGHLRLRAGIHVSVQGFESPFDGIYYVTQAVHSIDSGGYKTQFTLRRPGISDPSLFPNAAAVVAQPPAPPPDAEKPSA